MSVLGVYLHLRGVMGVLGVMVVLGVVNVLSGFSDSGRFHTKFLLPPLICTKYN